MNGLERQSAGLVLFDFLPGLRWCLPLGRERDNSSPQISEILGPPLILRIRWLEFGEVRRFWGEYANCLFKGLLAGAVEEMNRPSKVKAIPCAAFERREKFEEKKSESSKAYKEK